MQEVTCGFLPIRMAEVELTQPVIMDLQVEAEAVTRVVHHQRLLVRVRVRPITECRRDIAPIDFVADAIHVAAGAGLADVCGGFALSGVVLRIAKESARDAERVRDRAVLEQHVLNLFVPLLAIQPLVLAAILGDQVITDLDEPILTPSGRIVISE
jgi:hypothetical protein